MNNIQTSVKDTIQNVIQHIDIDSLKTEIITNPENPLYIKSVNDGNFDWGFLITTVIALISTAIVIYDRIKKPKIGAKILSLAYSPKATFNGIGMDRKPFTINGQQYFLKLSLQVTLKNFFFNDVEITVKYAGDKKIYNGRIFWADPITWNFDDGKTFDLHIPKNNFLWFNNTLPLNVVSFQYLAFMVEVDKLEMIEEFEIIFITPTGKRKKIKPLRVSEMDPMKALFDKEIWIERK